MNDVKRRAVIGVMGSGDPALPSGILSQAEAVGELIARAGALLLCGGRTGIMEAAARGAKSAAGGETVAILPGADRNAANPFMDTVVATGMGNARNVINVLSSDSIIAFPGGAGTLSEIALAVKSGVHTIPLGGWDPENPAGAHDAGAFRSLIHPAKTPEEAVRMALDHVEGMLFDPDEVESQVREMLESRAEAWNEENAEAFCHFYWRSADLLVSIEGSVIRGFDGVSKRLKKLFSHPHAMPFPFCTALDEVQIARLPGNSFVANYDYGAPEEGEVFGLSHPCTSVFVPCNGRLRVIADHL